MARVAVRHVAEVFQCQAVVLLPDADGKLRYPAEAALDSSFRGADLAVAQWVVDHSRRAGLGTDTLPAAPGLYVPLGEEGRAARGAGGAAGTSAARAAAGAEPPARDLRRADRAWPSSARGLPSSPRQSSLAAERETLRNTLLASISHDLRTPLAVMAGAGSTLAEHGTGLDEATRAAAGALRSRRRRARCRSWSPTCST